MLTRKRGRPQWDPREEGGGAAARSQGSWLEIGTSISHLIIASGFIVFLAFLFYISDGLVGAVLVPRALSLRKAQ